MLIFLYLFVLINVLYVLHVLYVSKLYIRCQLYHLKILDFDNIIVFSHLPPYSKLLPCLGLKGADVLVELELAMVPEVDGRTWFVGPMSHSCKQPNRGNLEELNVQRL